MTDHKPDKKAIDRLVDGEFPDWWNFIPVAGKETYVKEWGTKPLTRAMVIATYKANYAYKGIGVVTGEFSGGLIALDIDGFDAEARYKAYAGDEYEPRDACRTMATTSGKPGRRQLFYRVPQSFLPELKHLHTLILREDGQWYLGDGDENRKKAREAKEAGSDKPYEEVVLRFNKCQSVLPGSPHPETKLPYQWLHYNDRQVSLCPEWILDLLLAHRKPVAFFDDAQQKALDAELGPTLLPSRQIRGWFFKEEVQAKLRPRLEELVFKHPTFDQYGWKVSGGEHPHMRSGCPWHGGTSGTSFSWNVDTGCWHCKACAQGGDILDFIHRTNQNDIYADKPQGPDLEQIVVDLVTPLGFHYPEDAQIQFTKDLPRVSMTEREFHEALVKIFDEETNPALRMGRMAGLAAETGRRLTGSQALAAMTAYRYYEQSKAQNSRPWWEGVEQMDYLLPNLLMKPSQVLLHAAGGIGKTSACMGLARIVGRGMDMRIRGIDLSIKQGRVLWIQNDQNPSKLLRDCEDNGIDPRKDDWFIVKRNWQLDHINEFRDWIREYKPSLVIVDSIGSCSTQMAVEEREKAYAMPFYAYASMNGDPDGFPATSIIWIHHDNAQGEARGNRYLVAAIDEQWHLRALEDSEKESLRASGNRPSNCRMIQIKKSRLGRQGDVLVVERDADFAYSLWDYTPTERKSDGPEGPSEPHTVALRIVRDFVKQAREAGSRDRVTAKEVWEQLANELVAKGEKGPSLRSVQRWLERWVADGVLVAGKPVPVEGQRKPAPSFELASSHARVITVPDEILSFHRPDPLQTLEIMKRHELEEGPGVVSSVVSSEPAPTEAALVDESEGPEQPFEQCRPDQAMKRHATESGQGVVSSNPVFARALADETTNPKNGVIKPGTVEAPPEADPETTSEELSDEPTRAPIWSPRPWMGNEIDFGDDPDEE